jgi:hypothetical protein
VVFYSWGSQVYHGSNPCPAMLYQIRQGRNQEVAPLTWADSCGSQNPFFKGQ